LQNLFVNVLKAFRILIKLSNKIIIYLNTFNKLIDNIQEKKIIGYYLRIFDFLLSFQILQCQNLLHFIFYFNCYKV